MPDETRIDLRRWETIDRQMVVDASPWLQLFVEKVQLPDGRVVEDFYTIDMPDSVMIVAFDLKKNMVVERHYKHGPRRVILALPAGFVDCGESLLQAAERELLEETGYGGGSWEVLGAFVVDGNRGCGRCICCLAQGVERLTEPSTDDLEERHVTLFSPLDFGRAITQREVIGLPSVCAFLLACSRLSIPVQL